MQEATITFRRPVSIAGYQAKSAHGSVDDRPADREWRIQVTWVEMADTTSAEVSGHHVYVPYANVDAIDFS